jgi:hypothetical protein
MRKTHGCRRLLQRIQDNHIAKDGVEAYTQEDQEQGLKYLEYVYNAKIMTVDKIISEF